MNILDIFRRSSKASAVVRRFLPIVSPWAHATFLDPNFYTLRTEGYQANSAVFACTSALAFAFIEPSLKVYGKDDQELPDHPTRQLITRPNDLMGDGELMLHTISYMAIGGNAYWHKIRNSSGQVIEIKPYHIGNIAPVPGRELSWVDEYEFDDGTGQKHPIPKEDIVHFKWPSVDMGQPWIAMPPLFAALREVATDSESIRFLKAMLQNDAIPRTVLYNSENSNLDIDDTEKVNRLKAQFRAKYGGDNRGDIAIMAPGMKVDRLSLNMEELNFNGIHRIPESRICAVMRVPAIVAGLNVGLENSTYSNYHEAREGLTQDTLSPLWKLTSSEVNSDPDLNPNGDIIRFDLSEVQSLQEDTNSKWARLTAALTAGGITVNDFRKGLGYQEVERGNIFLIAASAIPTNLEEAPKQADTTPTKDILGYHIEQGVVSRNEARARLGLAEEDASQDEKLRGLQALLAIVKLAVDATIPLESALALVGLAGVEVEKPEPELLPAPAPEPAPATPGSTRRGVEPDEEVEADEE